MCGGIEDVERKANAAFDARMPQNEARAREIYLADRDKYSIPEQVEASLSGGSCA